MPEDPFFALRDRAFDLAETGRFGRWDQVASALKAEGFVAALIARLHDDRQAVMMISRCCAQAQSRA